MGEDEVGKVMYGKILGIRVEKLGEEALGGEVIDVGVGVEELEVNVDKTLLTCR